MARILLRREGVLKQLASINVTHDGSLRLSLVRDGTSDKNWTFQSNHPAPKEVDRIAQKTKEISIHTSGRINYHFDNAVSRFIPALMDLEVPIKIVGYRVPSFDLLDLAITTRQDDTVIEIPPDCGGVIQFHFFMIAAATPILDDELTRFGVEGLYALACVNTTNSVKPLPPGVPERAFTTCRPIDSLSGQAISEQTAFIRFKRAMFANDVRAAVASSEEPIPEGLIEAAIAAGPGLYPPNREGVWTIVTTVEMRLAPKLRIKFDTEGLTAEIVELRPNDTRLATVRVRFRVRDSSGDYVKGVVPIRSIELDAEL
jgi:hypothetical protein